MSADSGGSGVAHADGFVALADVEDGGGVEVGEEDVEGGLAAAGVGAGGEGGGGAAEGAAGNAGALAVAVTVNVHESNLAGGVGGVAPRGLRVDPAGGVGRAKEEEPEVRADGEQPFGGRGEAGDLV